MSAVTPRLPPPRRPLNTGRLLGQVLTYTALVLLAILFLIPYYIIFRNALLSQPQITAFTWTWLPIPPRFENLRAILEDPTAPMLTGLRNSAIIATVQTSGSILLASMAGYGLARIPYRWANQVFFLMLVTLMIPGAVTFVPSYVLVASFGWINTLHGIIVPGLFSTFNAFLFRQFYLEFPSELEDAGRVDGLSYWGIYRHILLPNSVGIITALGLLGFIGSWNAFLWPLIIGQRSAYWTVQIVLSTFLTAQTINLPALFMGAAIAVLPLLLIFIFAQSYIVEGVKATGIKG
ncbi:carbohydrate ABC transporter permease [Candidatus Gracilibacteria bacterium]|nr:carbohydrate ABC transporter permease [Candidatus Gracilibacteria bacterium]